MIKIVMNLWLMIGFVFFACDRYDPAVVDVEIHLTIADEAGDDLLNPGTENAIAAEDIQVFYEIDGKQETYQSINPDTGLDHSKGFFITPPEGSGLFSEKYHLTVFSNPTAGDQVITTIQIAGRDDIRVVTTVTRKNGNTKVERIWNEDVLVWSSESGDIKHVPVVY